MPLAKASYPGHALDNDLALNDRGLRFDPPPAPTRPAERSRLKEPRAASLPAAGYVARWQSRLASAPMRIIKPVTIVPTSVREI